jgi:hypothetical protein
MAVAWQDVATLAPYKPYAASAARQGAVFLMHDTLVASQNVPLFNPVVSSDLKSR